MELEPQTRIVILEIWKRLFVDFLHWSERDVEEYFRKQSFTGLYDGDLGMYAKYGGFAMPFVCRLVSRNWRGIETESREMLEEILWDALGALDDRNYTDSFDIRTRYRLFSAILDGLKIRLPCEREESTYIDVPFIQAATERVRDWRRSIREEIGKWSDEDWRNEILRKLLDDPEFDRKELIREGANEYGAVGKEGW